MQLYPTSKKLKQKTISQLVQENKRLREQAKQLYSRVDSVINQRKKVQQKNSERSAMMLKTANQKLRYYKQTIYRTEKGRLQQYLQRISQKDVIKELLREITEKKSIVTEFDKQNRTILDQQKQREVQLARFYYTEQSESLNEFTQMQEENALMTNKIEELKQIVQKQRQQIVSTENRFQKFYKYYIKLKTQLPIPRNVSPNPYLEQISFETKQRKISAFVHHTNLTKLQVYYSDLQRELQDLEQQEQSLYDSLRKKRKQNIQLQSEIQKILQAKEAIDRHDLSDNTDRPLFHLRTTASVPSSDDDSRSTSVQRNGSALSKKLRHHSTNLSYIYTPIGSDPLIRISEYTYERPKNRSRRHRRY